MDQRFDIECEWVITSRCTYKCEYCFSKSLNGFICYSANDIVQAFSKLGGTCLVYMTGGEPFLYPNYVDLCKRLTEQHYIGINTNLTTPNVTAFAKQIDPSCVVNVNASVHILEREKHKGLYSFVEKVLQFQERDFNIVVSYVAYPPLFERLLDDIRLLVDLGIQRVSVKVFRGIYQGKRYPESYTESEVRFLQKYTERADGYLTGANRFKNQLCYAGNKFIRVDPRGIVTRCASIDVPRGNIFEGTAILDTVPTPCTASRCKCLFHADRYLVANAKTKAR